MLRLGNTSHWGYQAAFDLHLVFGLGSGCWPFCLHELAQAYGLYLKGFVQSRYTTCTVIDGSEYNVPSACLQTVFQTILFNHILQA